MKKTIYFAIILSQVLFILCLPWITELFSYLHWVVIIVLWLGITAFVFFILFLIKQHTLTIPRYLWNILFIIYSICLLFLLFSRPGGAVYDNWNVIPFSTIGLYLSGNVDSLIAFYNLAANIILFIPFGVSLRLAIKSRLMRFLIPFFSISIIEFVQLITHRGSLDIDDFILNMVGVYVGYLLFPIFNRVVIIRK